MVVHWRPVRAVRGAALIVAGAALAMGLVANPASAATTSDMSAFTGSCFNNIDIGISISGSTERSYPITRSFKVELWGSDSFSDDHLFTILSIPPVVEPVSGTAGYFKTFCVSPSTLDEDWGTDEVYAKVFFYNSQNAAGPVIEQARSNQLRFNF